jgi:hypothetical protein
MEGSTTRVEDIGEGFLGDNTRIIDLSRER